MFHTKGKVAGEQLIIFLIFPVDVGMRLVSHGLDKNDRPTNIKGTFQNLLMKRSDVGGFSIPHRCKFSDSSRILETKNLITRSIPIIFMTNIRLLICDSGLRSI